MDIKNHLPEDIFLKLAFFISLKKKRLSRLKNSIRTQKKPRMDIKKETKKPARKRKAIELFQASEPDRHENFERDVTCTRRCEFGIKQGKRTHFPQVNPFVEQLEFVMPAFLCRQMWTRHGYSLSDVKQTLKFFMPVQLWHLALLEKLCTSNPAVKISRANQTVEQDPTQIDHLVSGKTLCLKKLLKHFDKQEFPQEGILKMKKDPHSPFLPVHLVSAQTFHQVRMNIPSKITLETNFLKYSMLFIWNNASYVPVCEEDDGHLIVMTRIVELSTFLEIYRRNKDSDPIIITLNERPFALVEESFYIMDSVY